MKNIIAASLAALCTLAAGCSRSIPGSIEQDVTPVTPPVAQNTSLYTGPAPRPGPDILYRPLADAPQLQNTGVWQAAPILISGASAYRKGEFLYQDFLYDDHGGKQILDPGDERLAGGTSAPIFSMPVGTYRYPTGADYANNAADLVEMRVKPLADATAFRVTLNTLKNPELAAFTIALGGDAATLVDWPHGANVKSPAAYFLTVHGSTAELLKADGSPVAAGGAILDAVRRQYTVLVPHAAWNPGNGVVRMAAGVGLWDATAGAYLAPKLQASATAPGGAGLATAPAALFNVAFRYDEAFPNVAGLANAVGGIASQDVPWWRDSHQASALASGDISSFFASVDFAKLANLTDDDMPGQPGGVPQTGPMNRILASHFETRQGIDYSVLCGQSSGCIGEFLNQLQPYSIYVPQGIAPAKGWGLTLLLHSLAANYNQFSASHNQLQFGDRAPGSIVITPAGRGDDGWYYEYAGADTFEVWADVAARYPLDPAASAIAGYSMGGYGTYKFSTQFPDLFARAQPTVGPPGVGIWAPPLPPQPGGDESNTNRMLASVRHIPFLIWNELADELVPFIGPVNQAQSFATLNYRYEFDLYQAGEHLTLAVNDQFAPAADFLGAARIDFDPPHVTYVYNPSMDFAALGTASGHAYWVSDIVLRDASAVTALGTVDVYSEAFGVGDPAPSAVTPGAGVLMGGAVAPMAYASVAVTWGEAPVAAIANRLDITTTNVSSLTINPARAHVTCGALLNVNSDGPLAVKLSGC